MSGGTGPTQTQTPTQVMQITIEWMPQSGQLRVSAPEVDPVLVLGVLEAAKAAIQAGQIRKQLGISQSGLLMPGPSGRVS